MASIVKVPGFHSILPVEASSLVEACLGFHQHFMGAFSLISLDISAKVFKILFQEQHLSVSGPKSPWVSVRISLQILPGDAC